MSASPNNKWIRAYDESHEDCLIGSKEGWVELRDSIDDLLVSATENEDGDLWLDISARMDSDIHTLITPYKYDPSNGDVSGESKVDLLERLLISVVFCWFVILPFLGLFGLYILISKIF